MNWLLGVLAAAAELLAASVIVAKGLVELKELLRTLFAD
jgi:hypothetical protein